MSGTPFHLQPISVGALTSVTCAQQYLPPDDDIMMAVWITNGGGKMISDELHRWLFIGLLPLEYSSRCNCRTGASVPNDALTARPGPVLSPPLFFLASSPLRSVRWHDSFSYILRFMQT